MNKFRAALLATICIMPSTAYATTSGGFDSTVPELPIAVQGVAVLNLVQGHATVDGGLTVDGTTITHGYVGINTPYPTDALDVTGNAVVTGNLTVTGTILSKGDIAVGEDGTGCGGSTAGTMRFDAGSHMMQYCDGGSWQSLSSGAPSGTICGWNIGGGGAMANCQGVNPSNGCPSGYSQAWTWVASSNGQYTQPEFFCVKN